MFLSTELGGARWWIFSGSSLKPRGSILACFEGGEELGVEIGEAKGGPVELGLADWIGDADGGTSLGGEVRSGEAGRTEGWVANCGVWIPRILHSFLFCLSVNLATKKPPSPGGPGGR